MAVVCGQWECAHLLRDLMQLFVSVMHKNAKDNGHVLFLWFFIAIL